MKRHWMIALTAMFVLGLLATSALVQEPTEQERPRRARPRRERAEFMRGLGRREALPDYTRGIEGLTEEQTKKIAEIRKAALEKVKQLEEQMNAKIKGVLTPEQTKAMESAQRRVTHRGPGGVIMTDAQKKIIDDAREKAEKAESREERREIMREAYEKVRASYTEEQKKQAEEARPRGARRPRGRTRD